MTNSIKFFWNGLRLNGDKCLVKVSYSMDNQRGLDECVTIHADGYGNQLPRDIFDVRNDSDSYTDYFDTDSATLTPDHPLYKYARYAAVKAELRHLPRHIKYLEDLAGSRWANPAELEAKKARLAKLQAVKDPGHPRTSDLEAVYVMKLEAENARKAAEHEARLKAREEMLRKKNEGRAYIEKVAKDHPIKEGEPVVTINWSEHPAFYGWKDGELKLSVAAAEIILTHFDKEVHAEKDRGYDKTSFTINFVNEDGEQDTYEGRYDLGDDDGGMIQHIRAFGEFYVKKGGFGNGHPSDDDKELGREIIALADKLDGYTERGKIISVAFAPWLENAIRNMKDAADKQIAFVMNAVKQMSNDDLEAAVMAIDPEDQEREDVAEFFVKQLALRDIKKAMEVYQAWKNR